MYMDTLYFFVWVEKVCMFVVHVGTRSQDDELPVGT